MILEGLMIWSSLAQLLWLGFDVLGTFRQSEREQAIEVLLLRQQLRILERKQRRAPRVSRWEKLTLAVLGVASGFRTRMDREAKIG
jgi:hypothetical protein